MKPSIAERLRNAVRNFMHSPENSGKKTEKSRARNFIHDIEPDLAQVFLLDHVEGLMRAEERLADREAQRSEQREDPQMRLLGPGFIELFTSVRQRLPLKQGTKVMDLMTVSQFRESAVVIRIQARQRAEKHSEVHERRAQYLSGLADAMSPYAQTHRKLNFRDFRELRAAGVEADAKARVGKAGA